MNDIPNSVVGSRSASSRVGQVVDKYRIRRLLGEGGMGAVFEAEHTMIGRRVAIKFLQPSLASNQEMLARFRREAQAAGTLEHENIAAATDFGFAADGSPFMVIEYLEGEDFSHLLARQGPLPVQRAVFIVIQACRGLDAAHNRGVIHRDLKPENLFLCKRADGMDLVKILDFGIAKLRDPIGGATTRTGATMGTPYYMSIEQARGAKDVDHRTDIYALGVILYELLSGNKPHPGDSYNEIMFHILSNPVAPLDAQRSGLPAGLSDIVHCAMSNELEQRPSSAVALAEQLAPFAGRAVTPLRSQVVLPVAGSAEATVRGSDALAPATMAAGSDSPTAMGTAVTGARTGAPRRSWLPLLAAFLGVIALLAVVALWRPWQAGMIPAAATSAPPLAPASSPPLAVSSVAVTAPSGSSATPTEVSTPTVGGRQPGRQPEHIVDAGSKMSGPATATATATAEEPVPTAVKPGKAPRPYDTNNPY